MLLVDSREGSKQLLKPLLAEGIPAEFAMLEFGDFAFLGRGKAGADLFIGIELKTISDFCGSLRGRLPGHQLPGLLMHYQRGWLIIEGEWRSDTEGRVTVQREGGLWRPLPGAPPAAEVESRIFNLETNGGLHVTRVNTRRDTIRVISRLYRFFTDKDLDQHKSHLVIYNPDLDHNLLRPVSQFRRTICTLPGLSLKRSKAVEQHFQGSIRRAANAGIDEWAAITTTDDNGKARRLGKSAAEKIVAALGKGL